MSDRPLWIVDAMAAAMRARREGPLPESIGGISIDSRTLQSGDAFFAITGDTRDGHDFVDAALKAGAGLAVVAGDRRDSFAKDAPLLVVNDVLEGLRDLARAARARAAAKVIAVTGSVGKTSTKEALRLALSHEGEVHASAASYNNHWGVPLSLARCPQDARFAVFEIGMNHAGEITPLTKLVRPHAAIVTAIQPVHLEYFGSVSKIADAKAEIFLGVEAGGSAVIPRDSEFFDQLSQRATEAKVSRIVSFGEHAGADARLIDCALQPGSSTVHADILGHDVVYKLGAPGRGCPAGNRLQGPPGRFSRHAHHRNPGRRAAGRKREDGIGELHLLRRCDRPRFDPFREKRRAPTTGQSARERDEPVSQAAQGQSGALAAVVERRTCRSARPRTANPALRRLCRLPLVPRHGP